MDIMINRVSVSRSSILLTAASGRKQRMSDGRAPFKKLKFSFPPLKDSFLSKARATGQPNSSPKQSDAPMAVASGMYRVPGYMVWDHTFRVPLDWDNPSGQEISIFAREVISPIKSHTQLPYLLYLQGGPGFAANLPIDGGVWLKTATAYFRVILLDQRGTGRSSPITCWNLQKVGSPQEQADYLSHFRSDNIIKDAEHVRKSIVPPTNHNGKWSILGQSYGGFCCVRYLSAAPQGLSEVMLTGGIPPNIELDNSADEAYRHTYRRTIAQNEKYYERYPGDVEIVKNIVRHIASQSEGYVELPSGSKLTPRCFQMLGFSGLGFAGGFDRMHFLLETAFDGDRLAYKFLKSFETWMSWETNPIYAILHESIYTQGPATNWAADRIRQELFADVFDAVKAVNEDRPVYFTGEMVFPWMFEDFKELIPLKETADILAEKNDWPRLYDLKTLAKNTVCIASATYFEDMYVDYDLAQLTAKKIKGFRQWVSNEYMHSGLRDDGGKILEKLIGMARDSILLQ